MKRNPIALDLVIQAALKFNPRSPQWRNLIAFVQSCYACQVRQYDYNQAVASLKKLTPDEQHALIEWVMLVDAARSQKQG